MFKMLGYSVHNEFCIINPACLVCKLEKIHQSASHLDNVCVFLTLSMAFITSEVKTIGLRPFRAFTELFFGMRNIMERLHNWRTLLISTDFLNKS